MKKNYLQPNSPISLSVKLSHFLAIRGIKKMSTRLVLRLPEVENLTGLKKSSIYKLILLEQFPKQFKLSARSSGWLLEEVNDWIATRASTRTNEKAGDKTALNNH